MKQEGRCLKGLELMATTTSRRLFQNVPQVQEFRGRSGDPVLEIKTASLTSSKCKGNYSSAPFA